MEPSRLRSHEQENQELDIVLLKDKQAGDGANKALRHCRYFKTPEMSLPRHCGTSALHKPREPHSMLTDPFRAKPRSQVAVHRAPEAKGPLGLVQDRKPPGRSTGSHFFTLGNRRATESSVRYKLHKHNCFPDIFKTLETTRTVIVSLAQV